MDSEPVAQNFYKWHIAVVGYRGGVACDPLEFDSYAEALAAKGRLRSIGYASGDGTLAVHKGRHDVCEHLDVGNPR